MQLPQKLASLAWESRYAQVCRTWFKTSNKKTILALEPALRIWKIKEHK